MSRRTRNLRNRSVIIVESDDSCIDLTSPDGDADDDDDDAVVDLTSSQSNTSQTDNGANDNSVVVIGSTNDSPPAHRRRRLPDFDDDNDSLIELPPPPFNIPTPPRSSRDAGPSSIQSPDAIKITCPVCLDDDKTIKRGKKKLASTSCGHVFCQECIEDCVRTQHQCPVCRKRLNYKQVHVLHI